MPSITFHQHQKQHSRNCYNKSHVLSKDYVINSNFASNRFRISIYDYIMQSVDQFFESGFAFRW